MKKFLVLIFLLASSLAFSQNYQLHSVFMYSFTRYVQWPNDYNHGDFEIMVLGDSPIIVELKKLAETKKVGTRSIKITRINSIAEIKKGNILFIPTDKSNQLTDVLTKIGAGSTMVVTEQPGFGSKGSTINFIVKEGKLAFEMNQAVMNKQKLKASNELTRLAIII
jgi:nitrogen regulatory protein PII